jgi:hypothetical protein
LGAEAAEKMHEHRGAGNPIDIIITEDCDAFPLGGRDHEAFCGFP